MALTRLQLESKVLLWLDELDDDGLATNANTITRARVQEALNEANVTRAIQQKWPFMIADAELTFSTVVGQRVYTLDDSFHIARFFWNNSQNTELTEYRSDAVGSHDYDGGLVDDYFSSNAQYGGYILRGKKIELLWTPTAVETIRYGFYRDPVEMDDDADFPDIPYPHSRILIYDALLKMVVYNEDISPAKVEEWKGKVKDHEEALREAYGQPNSENTVPETITYIPR